VGRCLCIQLTEAGIGIEYAVLYTLRTSGVRCLVRARYSGSGCWKDLVFKVKF